MYILVIAAWYPMPDRLGGDHRFFRLLEGLTGDHAITYLAFSPASQAEKYGATETDQYRKGLDGIGVTVYPPKVRSALRAGKYDAVIFQYSAHATLWHREVRTFQPEARLVIDNGDVSYRRLFSKAELTGTPEDLALAESFKREELFAYRIADAITTVSQDDLATVREDIPNIRAFIIPNIHPIPRTLGKNKDGRTLLFIGSFLHPPNVDGMVWFVHEILPLIIREFPEARLQIVGYGPTPEIEALASPHVEVVGYVPDTAPYLDAAYLSIAPLRYGAGVKGKIGEAMAYRLPVVTTSVGIDGFGLTPDKNVLVADSPADFAAHVLRLLNDAKLHDELAGEGFQFIQARFSEEAVQGRIREMMAELPRLPVKRLSLPQRLSILFDDFLERRVRWRFRGRAA